MRKLSGRYLCSNEALLKAESYLNSLTAGTVKPGDRLALVLSAAKVTDFNTIDAKQLIAFLMDTRKPKIFAESEPVLDGTDWNLTENAILGDIVFSTTGTHAFNNGAHSNHINHKEPIDTNFIFIASALLKNGHGNQTSDMDDVLVNNVLNEESLYKLYERRLLPGLLIQNEQAKKDGVPLVINIPGLGCGEFAGQYANQVRAALPRALKRLFETHGAKLDMVRTVNYDPYKKSVNDEFTTDKIPNTQIKLMNRPLLGLPDGAPGNVASQLEFPKDGTNYKHSRLIKVVAWDHFSFPGNDLWVNTPAQGNGRATDDGVSFASSDVILALFNMGQFGSKSKVKKISYNPNQGIVYPISPEDGQILGYQDLGMLYPSHVSVEMIDVVPISNVALIKPQGIFHDFKNNINKIQGQFVQNLQILRQELNQCELNKSGRNEQLPSHENDGEKLYTTLFNNQEQFFNKLTEQTTDGELTSAIADFRKSCKEHMDAADQIMGHGWLFRITEVLIKVIVGLFAGIGMALGSLFGQGLVKSEHRQKFANTFFTLNQTDESRAIYKFKQEVLGNEMEAQP